MTTVGQIKEAFDANPVSVETAELTLRAAEVLLKGIERERSEALIAVENAFRGRINAAERDVDFANGMVAQAKSTSKPDHEWEGKIVIREEAIFSGRSWSARQTGSKTIVGIVKTMRPGMNVNGKWHVKNADVGTPLVFDIKKDGTPGLRATKFIEHESKWRLATAQEAASA